MSKFNLEAAVGQVLEMAMFWHASQETQGFSGPGGLPRKVDVVFIPHFYKGETKWTAEIIEDGKMSGFRECVFEKEMAADFPDSHEDALLWLKEFFELDMKDDFKREGADGEVPLGYTMADVDRMLAA